MSKNETILVVDDEAAIRKLTAEILESQGYCVFLASNAEDALDVLQSESIALVVSDVVMPGIDGFQLIEKVKRQHPGVKILLISGYNDYIAQGNSVEMLNKPFRSAELIFSVKKLFTAN